MTIVFLTSGMPEYAFYSSSFTLSITLIGVECPKATLYLYLNIYCIHVSFFLHQAEMVTLIYKRGFERDWNKCIREKKAPFPEPI